MTHTLMYDLVGYGAAVCTTVSFLPQLVRVVRHRSTRDISLGMFIIYCMGVALWLVFGIMMRNMPMMIANSITLALALAILILKLKFEAAEDRELEKAEL